MGLCIACLNFLFSHRMRKMKGKISKKMERYMYCNFCSSCIDISYYHFLWNREDFWHYSAPQHGNYEVGYGSLYAVVNHIAELFRNNCEISKIQNVISLVANGSFLSSYFLLPCSCPLQYEIKLQNLQWLDYMFLLLICRLKRIFFWDERGKERYLKVEQEWVDDCILTLKEKWRLLLSCNCISVVYFCTWLI